MQPDVVMRHPFIDCWRSSGYQYYTIPKEMLRVGKQFGLGLDEVMLYAFLRDRTTLSFKNGWIDAKSRVYIICTREEASKYIGWSRRKTVDMFARLVSSGLLTEVEQRSSTNLMKPKRLYVRQWAEPSVLHSAEELKNGGFPYITRENVLASTGTYYVLPRVFFESEALRGLSLRSIFLYIIALDTLHLSINYGKVDKHGLVWCTLDNDAVAEELGCSPRSLTTSYAELENLGLIVRKREGFTPTYRLYLRDYLPAGDTTAYPEDLIPKQPPEGEKMAPDECAPTYPQDLHSVSASSTQRGSKLCTADEQGLHGGCAKSAPGDSQNLHLNYPPFSHPSLSTLMERSFGAGAADASPTAPEAPVLAKKDFDYYYAAVQTQIDYLAVAMDIQDNLPEAQWESYLTVLDEVVRIMAKDLSAPGLYVRAGGLVLQKEQAQQAYAGIDRFIAYVLVKSIAGNIGHVKNPENYIHRSMLSAVTEHAGAAHFARCKIEMRPPGRDRN